MNASSAALPVPATELGQLLAAARLPDIPPPETLEALYGLGYRCLETAEYDKARAVFEVLQRMQPDRCDFVAGVGHAAFGQGDAEVALQQFILATELEPNNAGLMIGLGRAYRALGLAGHAQLALEMAETMAGTADPANANLARACLALMGAR
jgi:predicted Zn-dependent protease